MDLDFAFRMWLHASPFLFFGALSVFCRAIMMMLDKNDLSIADLPIDWIDKHVDPSQPRRVI